MRYTGLLALALTLCLVGCGEDKPAPVATKGTILMVVTNHGEIEPGEATGVWLEEFAVPFVKFLKAGYSIAVASPNGGKAPVDPRSLEEGKEADKDVLVALERTQRLGDLTLDDYVAVFFPGGHGTMFDLPEHEAVRKAVAHFIEKDQPAAFVCHGPAALVGATLSDGTSVVKGRKVTGFTDSEERAVKLDEKMPFLLETKLKELGGSFAGAENWQAHVVVDGNLITGQNPASSGGTADALLEQLEK